MKNSDNTDQRMLRRTGERVSIAGVKVDEIRFHNVVPTIDEIRRSRGGTVCFANVHMVVEANDDHRLARALETADLVLPDGMPLVWMQKLLGQNKAERARGKSVMVEVLRFAAASGLKVGYYGAAPEVLEAVKKRSEAEFPGLTVSYAYSPPFRELSKDEKAVVIREINAAKPDFLFVGLGCPKQELWMVEHRDKLACVMLGVGAAFDFYAGTVAESPEWLSRVGLEWLYRLFKEPRRLWLRYLSTNPRFLFLATRQLIAAKAKDR